MRLMRIAGESMTPALKPGELVLVTARRRLSRGDIVAARPSSLGGRAVVKRVAGLPRERVTLEGRGWRLGDDHFFLLGDRAEDSLDSRAFGPVSHTELLGSVRSVRHFFRFAKCLTLRKREAAPA